MKLSLLGTAIIGPGLTDWPSAQACLRGEQPWHDSPPEVPAPAGLPGAERRRVGMAVRVAMAAAQQLFDLQREEHRIDPARTPTVFTSSGGDGQNCHLLCEALAEPDPQVSPTRFTNSVHNAPAGYWSIASGCTEASASLCGYDGSFAAGLLEAALLATTEGRPVALVAYDVPYPFPLHAVRPIGTSLGIAMLLAPHEHTATGPTLRVQGFVDEPAHPTLADPGLEALRLAVPAARGLPLLVAIARRESRRVCIESPGGRSLAISVACP